MLRKRFKVLGWTVQIKAWRKMGYLIEIIENMSQDEKDALVAAVRGVSVRRIIYEKSSPQRK